MQILKKILNYLLAKNTSMVSDTKTSCSKFIDLLMVEQHFQGAPKNEKLINTINSTIDNDKLNIYILDDVERIAKIISAEIKVNLTKLNKIDNINIIPMFGKNVGFDFLNIIHNLEAPKIDILITDITFGGNNLFNGKKIILDGVDCVILATMKNPKLKYIFFTGNILSESNIRNFIFAKKFLDYFKDSILKHTILKEVDVTFSNNDNIILKNLIESI